VNLVAASVAALAVHAGIGTLAAWYGAGIGAQVAPSERLVVYLPPPEQPEPVPPQPELPQPPPPPEARPEEPPPPVVSAPQPPRVVLGIDESKAQSRNWQGFAEATEHQARKSEVEQPEIAPDPGAPAADQGPQAPPAPAAQQPGPQPTPGQTSDTQTTSPRPPSPQASPRDVPAADSPALGPQPETGQQPGPPRSAPASPKPQEQPAPPIESPKPDPASLPPPPKGEPDVPDAPTPEPVKPEPRKPEPAKLEPARLEPTKPEPSVSGAQLPAEGMVVEVPAPALPAARAGKPVRENERPREPAAAAADELPRERTLPEPAPPQPTTPVSPAEFVGPPLPPSGSPSPGQDAQTAAPLSPPADRPAPASPPTAGGGAPAPASGSRPALKSESDASASALVEPIAVQPGKVIAAHGLRIRTVRPRFSTTTLITASPRDATVRLTFRKNGTVRKVEFLPGGNTGFPDVDRPLVDALYSWTAKGLELDKLPPSPEASLALEFKILMR